MRRGLAARLSALGVLAFGAAALPAEGVADALQQAPVLPDQSCLTPPGAAAAPTPAPPQAPPVLVDGLGYAGLEPDSANREARAWFAQGVRLVWAFDEVEAIRAFQAAQRADPDCALCFFGEAWARGPTINLQPRTEELGAARTAARRAAALSARLGPRDQALIRGMTIRTGDGDGFRNRAYARFMERAAQRLPEDDTLAIMAADARMVVSDAMRPGALSQRLLERVLARNPGHGGAIHFYIHLTDWIDRQHLAVPHAERLGRIAPAASHLVHMPSHSFYGVGRYRDAAAVNVAAITADRAYVARVRPPASDYRTGLLAHNMHFAIESALARGDGATALDVSRDYARTYLGADGEARYRILGSATWYSRGLHEPVGEVLAIPAPDRPAEKAMRHYARGEALARRGDAAGVRAEAAAIAALRAGTEAPALGRGGSVLAEIFQHVLEGRAAMLAGDHEAAQRAYRLAMKRQLKARFGNDPPLFWYSVRRSLGAAMLAGGDARGARAQLTASLATWPDDALALHALALAERTLGDAAAAERHAARARAVWAGDPADIPLPRI